MRTDWNGKPYYSLDFYLRETFGRKVYKLALDGGMSCPNRDGTLGTRGCIFCGGDGSGYCTACFDGNYPVEPPVGCTKSKYERKISEAEA